MYRIISPLFWEGQHLNFLEQILIEKQLMYNTNNTKSASTCLFFVKKSTIARESETRLLQVGVT